MQQQKNSISTAASGVNGVHQGTLSFLIDENLGLKIDEEPIASAMKSAGITATLSTGLEQIDKEIIAHKPDIAHIPIGDFHRLVEKGDHYYQGLAQATAKFSGQVSQRSLLIVRREDPATSLGDLQGSKYGIINRSCSSTYFPPAILLGRQGKKIDGVLQVTPVKPGPTGQGLVDAVVSERYGRPWSLRTCGGLNRRTRRTRRS